MPGVASEVIMHCSSHEPPCVDISECSSDISQVDYSDEVEGD